MEIALIVVVFVLGCFMPRAFKYLVAAPLMGIMFGLVCYGLMLIFNVADLTLHSLRHYSIFGIAIFEILALLT